MKKLFSCFLIGTVFFSTIIIPGLNVNAANSLNEVSEINEGYYSESFELDGVQYFYENTNSYTITITKANNGEESIAYKDKTSGKEDEIYYHHKPGISEFQQEPTILNETREDIKSLNATDVNELKKIKEKVLNDELIFEKLAVQDIVTEIIETENKDTIESFNTSSDAGKIDYSLSAVYGQAYTNKYLTGLYRDGISATLIQHMTFSASLKTSFIFDALTGIGIVATILGTPPVGLLGLAAWVSAGAAGHQLKQSTPFKQWNTKVHYQKEVKIGTIYPYRAFNDLSLLAATGPQGFAALSDVLSTRKDNDFDSNSTLLNKGIDLYKSWN